MMPILCQQLGDHQPGERGGVTECVFKMAYVFKMCCTIPANSIKCFCGVAVWLWVDVNGRLVD